MEFYSNCNETGNDLFAKQIPTHEDTVPAENSPILHHSLTDEQSKEMRNLFFTLAKILTLEAQHQIDALFLQRYLTEGSIPRGLRVNLNSTFMEEASFVDARENILDICSTSLLNLILNKRNTLLRSFQQESDNILTGLAAYHTHLDFDNLNSRIKSEVHSMELELIEKKTNCLGKEMTKQTLYYRPWCRSERTNKNNNTNRDNDRLNY